MEKEQALVIAMQGIEQLIREIDKHWNIYMEYPADHPIRKTAEEKRAKYEQALEYIHGMF